MPDNTVEIKVVDGGSAGGGGTGSGGGGSGGTGGTGGTGGAGGSGGSTPRGGPPKGPGGDDSWAKHVNLLASVIQTVPHIAANVVRAPDAVSAAAGTANAGASLVGGVGSMAMAAGGPVGMVVGAALLISAAVVKAGVDFGAAVVGAADSFAEKAAGLHGGVASAQAQADVASLMGDIRRSDMMADQLADFIKAQSGLEQSFEDFKAQIVQSLLPTIINIMEGLKGIIDSYIQNQESIRAAFYEGLNNLIDFVNRIADAIPGLTALGVRFDGHFEFIRSAMPRREEPLFDEIWGLGGAFAGFGFRRDAILDPRPARAPIFNPVQ